MGSKLIDRQPRAADGVRVLPLSYGQRALWYMQRLFPESPVYNLQSTWRVLSELDLSALRRTFQWLTDRHEALRTTYGLDGRDPVQIAHPRQDVFFKIHDAADWSDQELRAGVEREVHRPFDLEKGPLFKVHVFMGEPGRHILLTSFHHLVVDLWSMTLIYQEMQRLYPAARDGKIPAPPPAAPYADYLRWQEAMLRGPESEKLWDYWKGLYAGGVRPLEFAADFPRSPAQTFAGAAFPFKLERGLTGRLKALAGRCQATMNAVLLAGFEVLLSARTDRDRFLIRTLTVGRGRAEWETIVGFFANPAVLRADFAGRPDFLEAVSRAQASVTGAVEHQAFPFELLMEKLRFGRRIPFNPMPAQMFVLQAPQRFLSERQGQTCVLERGMFAPGNTGVRVDFGGLLAEKVNPETRTTLNDLDLQAVEIGGEVSGAFNYRTDLFLPSTAARFADEFRRILEIAADSPQRPVASLLDKVGKPRPAETSGAAVVSGPPAREPAAPAAGVHDDIERRVLAMASEILGAAELRPEDNFFEAGGNSLLALQLTILVREEFRVDLPLRGLFENPTVAGAAGMIRAAAAGAGPSPIPPAAGAGGWPLSYAQERLWFIDRLMGGSPFYNIPVAVRLRGALDVPALERSLNEVVKRQASLRTAYELGDGGPVQKIVPWTPLEFSVEDLERTPGGAREREARERMAAIALEPFDLASGALLRFRLFRLEEDHFLALLVVHHIAADAWSFGVLLRDLAAFYGAFSGRGEVSLPVLPIRYADFAVWHRRALSSPASRDDIDYWETALQGAPAFELPTDRPRPAVQTFSGKAERIELSTSLFRSLTDLGVRERATPFMVLLAAFLSLLQRHSGQDDIVIGTPTAGRTRPEVEGLVGCFINLLPIRVRLEGDPSFRELLGRVREAAIGALSHQDAPFEKLVEELRPPRDLGREPFFQVMFVLQNAPLPAMTLAGGVGISPFDLDVQTTRYDLTLFLTEAGESCRGWLEYSPDLFRPETAARLAAHFRTLLAAVLENPGRRISELPLMDAAERTLVLERWNRTETEAPAGPVHELFEKQALASPGREAVVSGDGVVSYGELDARAEAIAAKLVGLGVGPERIVGVCLERSALLPAAVLGVLKAGAAFLPVDPAFPDERLSWMLSDAGALCVITFGDAAPRLSKAGIPVLCLDAPVRRKASGSPARRRPRPHPDHLAYVIYTSGSAGRPKGVMVSHRALANYLEWARGAYRMEEGSGVLLNSSIAYDFALTTLLGPLVAGQKILLAPPWPAGLSAAFLEQAARDLTLMKLTPPQAKLVADIMAPGKLAGATRTLVLGGEALREDQIARWRETAGRTAVFNEYGPTEATVGCCVYRLPGAPSANINVPVGYPIANTRLHILDRDLNPAPLGIPGELYVGGLGLARGYLRRPGLTAERFIPDPFGPEPGGRLYRTGDLARRLPDGAIEFLGRTDDQVKIRGYRVEIGEVEAALAACPGVREAAVTPSAAPDGSLTLTAHLVPNRGAPVRPETVRESLRRLLPDYMIPTSFVFPDSLPVSSSGKVDRRALRTARPASVPAAAPSPRPSTAVEKEIARIFETTLGVRDIGLDDDFFELGGHSLSAVTAVTKIRQTFPRAEAALVDFFRNPTVRGLAGGVGKPGPGPAAMRIREASLVVLKQGGDGLPLFFAHPPGGNVFAYRHLAASLEVDGPVYGIRSKAVDHPDLEFETIDAMAHEYARLLRRAQPRGPYRLAGWSKGGDIAAAVASALEATGSEVAFLGLLDPSPGAEISVQAGRRLRRNIFAALLASAAGDPAFPHPAAAGIIDGLMDFYESLPASSGAERAGQVARRAIAENVVPPGLPESFVAHTIRLIEIHERLLQGRLRPSLKAPVHIWWTDAEPRSFPAEPSRITGGPVSRHFAEGDHWSMLTPPRVQSLAGEMSRILGVSRGRPMAGSSAPEAAAGGGPGDPSRTKPGPGPRSILEEERTRFRIVRNAERQYALWPEPLPVPPGWTVAAGPAAKAESLELVEKLWTDMRPASLMKRQGSGA